MNGNYDIRIRIRFRITSIIDVVVLTIVCSYILFDISQQQETPNNILLITILNLVYPVTIEALHQIFSKYGTVLKIIIFQKNGTF